jgi:hypothetical protein
MSDNNDYVRIRETFAFLGLILLHFSTATPQNRQSVIRFVRGAGGLDSIGITAVTHRENFITDYNYFEGGYPM